MVSFLAARRVEGGWWTIWLFGFNNQINHLVQLFGSPARVWKGGNKKEKIYIIGTGCVQRELTFWRSLISEKTMYTREKREKHTAKRQRLWKKIIDG